MPAEIFPDIVRCIPRMEVVAGGSRSATAHASPQAESASVAGPHRQQQTHSLVFSSKDSRFVAALPACSGGDSRETWPRLPIGRRWSALEQGWREMLSGELSCLSVLGSALPWLQRRRRTIRARRTKAGRLAHPLPQAVPSAALRNGFTRGPARLRFTVRWRPAR